MEYKYWLPDINGNRIEKVSASNAVILIGANGAGKSHLGAWIEQQDLPNVHRIGAQRNLNFKDNIALKSFSQAEDLVLYGNDFHDSRTSKIFKYGSPKDEQYTLKMVDDFENVLSAMIAKKNVEFDHFIEQCKVAEKLGQEHPHTPNTCIDKLMEIWNDIFPHRELKLEDSKFRAVFKIEENQENIYSATKMSDGERSVLYFAAQVLCVPNNKILIIDEPELHLHKSLMDRLWSHLEKIREDCLFIYITHDTQFASEHSNADIIWVKEYDGASKWLWNEIEESELPEELLLELLGSRKPILFVEGEKNSFDTQLYAAIYSNYYVVACGSCTQVIAKTKAFRNNAMLHHNSVYGIIDRDYRTNYEIEKFETDGIYSLTVAEVENLFILESVIKAVARHFAADENKSFNRIYNFIVKEEFAKKIDSQICKSIVTEIKYYLSVADLNTKNVEKIKENLDELIGKIDYKKIKKENEDKFYAALKDGNYSKVIEIFNEKNLAKRIGQYIDGVDTRQYCQVVVNLVKKGNKDIIKAIEAGLPSSDKIPR